MDQVVRFKERDTNFLYDAKMMEDGVIVRQCPPMDWNISFVSFEEFLARFEETTLQE